MRVAAFVSWGLGRELVKTLCSMDGVEVRAVVGRWDDKGDDPWADVVRIFCEEAAIPFYPAEDVSAEDLADLMQREKIDLAVTHAWHAMLPESVYGAPRLGTLNFHASLLPKHRGRSPHLAVLRDGDSITGLTCHLVDDGMDTGPIVAQTSCTVDANDTAESLVDKVKELAAPLLRESVTLIMTPGFTPRPQQSGEEGVS